MDRAYASGSSGTAPTAPVSPSIGFPTAGNPGTATPATKPGPWWYHMVTEELRKVIVDAGLTPDHTDLAQLSAAVQALASVAASTGEIAAFSAVNKFIRPDRLASAFANSLAASGYQKLPGGLIFQWGTTASIASSVSSGTITFPIAFPNDCVYLNFIGTSVATSGANTDLSITTKTTSNFSFLNAYLNAAAFNWLAVGY